MAGRAAAVSGAETRGITRGGQVKREPLDSSSLRSAGYDPAAHVLEVEFRNGGVYQYLEVPGEEFEEFIAAPSKGRYLNAEIKSRYPSRRLQPPQRRH